MNENGVQLPSDWDKEVMPHTLWLLSKSIVKVKSFGDVVRSLVGLTRFYR